MLCILTGWYLRPKEACLNSPISKNKILAAYLAFVFWISYLAIWLKAGGRIWDRGFIGHYAYVMSLAGFVFLVVTNSIGGDLAGIPSGYERFASALGFRTRYAIYFPTHLNIALWLVGVAALLYASKTFRAATLGVRL